MGILQNLYIENAITEQRIVRNESTVISLTESFPALAIFGYVQNDLVLKSIVNKWKFQDAMMGEQYIMFTITSEKPIDWAVGDYCVFRGERYTLNYVPTVTQKARTGERQDAYTYENVKFESFQEELTRCIMLDITATSGLYVAALGTNYTGSSRFTLFCGETMIDSQGHVTSDATQAAHTFTAVCALVAKMQANLDRLYTSVGWTILVDTTTSFVDATGATVLNTHTDDKVLTFDNTTVAQALAEVHNTFGLDYCIRGREIRIGYNLKNLTSDNSNETFSFAYGKGHPTRNDMNKGLFQLKRISNPQQKIVTRLRALGSTKNMPYRYYNKKYATPGSDLSQALFPTNLQLPDTFLPEGGSEDVAGTNTKWGHNNQRESSLAKVKGNTNDAYIDKNNDAEGCDEGVREECARWDGSNGDLPEIYPTIEEATYGELRNALVVDQDGNTGNGSFPNYFPNERVDKLLAIGYKEDGSLIDDANKGDGILPESGISSSGVVRSANIGLTTLSYGINNQFTYDGFYFSGKEHTLFTIQGVMPGKYAMSPTNGHVFFVFNLSYRLDVCSADVGFQIVIKQKSQQTGTVTTLATYTSDLTNIHCSDGIREIELPEIPDARNVENAQVSEIRVTTMSDIIVTFKMIMSNVAVPTGFDDDFSITYRVGTSSLQQSTPYDPEYTWFPLKDSETLTDQFHVFVQDMGFDIEACWSDDTPKLAMKSGYCVGREFEILEDIEKVSHNGKKGYMLTLKRAEDSSINTYYPSETNPIAAGDYFVLLGIQMPDAYVKAAEVRLLRAATQFLADNCETKFTYQPYIDDIYLQQNYDNMVAAGTPEASVFWRLYAGLKFTFRGVPATETEPLPLADITIEKVSITMGEGLTPKVELTLNDDVQQSTLQKLTTNVDRIYNGSIFSGGSIGVGATGAMSAALMSILQSEGSNLFLSKVKDDEADGKITFNDIVTHNETLKAKKGVKVGNFQSRLLGSGALIDEHGNAEFESIYSRNFISTPEFRFNRISVTEGEQWCTNGYGTIQEVDIIDNLTGYITLKLEENDYTSLAVGDICRGIYNDIAHEYETASLDDDTELYAGQDEISINGFGFSSKQGFFTSYFWIRDFVVNKKGECKFLYELRNSSTPHPCEYMKFAQYGNFDPNSGRNSSSYSSSIGKYFEMGLYGVTTWKIRSGNVTFRKGWLGEMTIDVKQKDKFGNFIIDEHGEYVTREVELQGYGLYVQDNVYFGNAFVQLDPLTLSDIENELSNYTVDFSSYVDVIIIDDVGNCIGGLFEISGNNDENISYRIQSAITVRKSGTLLTLAANNVDTGTGKYKIYAEPHGCTCVIENSTIYITGIENIKDGIAGSPDDTNFDYDAMRAMDYCYVDLYIDCEGKGSIQKRFSVTIKHQSEPYVSASMREVSSVSWNTKTQAYIGLPIVLEVKMWHNNEILDIENVSDISLSCATTGVSLVSGAAPASPASNTIYYTKSIWTVVDNAGTEQETSYKVARISITHLPENLPLVTDLNVTTAVTYAGVRYERTLRHTINKSTDNNVYWLLPDPTDVSISYNANKQKVINTDRVYCSVRCDSTDDEQYTVPPSDYATHGFYITYQTFSLNASNVEVGGTETAYSNVSGVTVSTDMTRIRFTLYKLIDPTLSTLSSLLAPSNVIEVINFVDVYVILNGLDGDDSVQVILDNDSDNVMCVEDGTVIASTLPVTHACLMDGNDAIGGATLGTTLAQDKQSFGTFSSGTLTQGWHIDCTNCSAEIVGWVTIDSKPYIRIRVKTVTDDTASVSVKCLYTKYGQSAYYSRLFTFSKLYGLDKHEIMFNPNSIHYNANNDSYSPTKFLITVYKTTQEEERHLMTTMPRTGTDANPVDRDYRLQYSTDKGTTWNTLTGYTSGVYIRESSDSGTGNKFNWDNLGSIEVRLQQYVGSEWVLCDQECEDIIPEGRDGKGVEYIFFAVADWDGVDEHMPTLYDDSHDGSPYTSGSGLTRAQHFQLDDHCPFTDVSHYGNGDYQWTDEPTGVSQTYKYEFFAQRKKVNGVWQAFSSVKFWDKYKVDGITPYMMDLSNEQSLVNCDENGNVLSGADYETSRIMIFKGTSYAFTDFNIRITPTNITCNGNTTYFDLSESQKSTAQSDGYFTLIPSAIAQNSSSAQITVTATLKANTSVVLTAVYKINKNMGGHNGVIYALMPSINVVHRNISGTLTNASMSVQVKKVVGITSSNLTSSTELSNDGLTLKYTQGSSTTENDISNPESIDTATLLGSSTYFTLLLRKGSTVVDKERINVVSDGDAAPVAFASPDKISIPCNTNGSVTSEVQQNVNFSMKVGTNNASVTNVSYDSALLPTGVSISPVSTGIVRITVGTTATANGINAGVAFHVTGTSNGKTYLADVTVALIGSIKGDKGGNGDNGSDGIFPRDCGLFDPNIATNRTFNYAGYIYRKVGDFVIRDKVVYEIDGVMYGFLVRSYSDTALITDAPTSASGDSNWESSGIVTTVIANTVFGTNANIGGFMTSNQIMRSTATTDGTKPKLLLDGQNGRIEAHEGMFTGFVRKRKTSITISNINDYKRTDILGPPVLDFDKCGSFVELNNGTASYITLPLLSYDIATNYSQEQKDQIRSYIGVDLLIHNKTGESLQLSLKKEDNKTYYVTLTNGHFIELRCLTETDSSFREVVYWEEVCSGAIL